MDFLENVERRYDALQIRLHQLTFTKQKQISFLRDLINLLPYIGSPIEILKSIEKQSQADKKALAHHLIRHLQSGNRLSDGMDGWFDPVLINATRVGEEQGILAESLGPALDMMSQGAKQIVGALKHFVMPIAYSLIVIFIWSKLHDSYLPVLLKIAKGDVNRIPPDAAYLKEMIEWAFAYGWLIPVGLLTFFLGLRWFLRTYVGKYRNMLDQLPVFQHYALIHGSGFIRIYTILKKVEVSEKDIIKLARDGASPYFDWHLRLYLKRLNEGVENMGEVFSTSLLSNDLAERLRLLSGSKYFVEAMEVAAKEINERLYAQINSLARCLSYVWLGVVVMLIIATVKALMSSNQIAM